MRAVYIPFALLPQRTRLGYDYGGVVALEKIRAEGGGLDDFNLEQQADIISDAYCLRSGMKPRWSGGDESIRPVFEDFLRKLQPENRARRA